MQKELGKPTDPYADDSAAAFYRLPAGVRKAKRNQEKEEQGEKINRIMTSIIKYRNSNRNIKLYQNVECHCRNKHPKPACVIIIE